MIKIILKYIYAWAYKNNLIRRLIRIYDPPFAEEFPLRFDLQGEFNSQPLRLPDFRVIHPLQDRLYYLFLDELNAKEANYRYGYYCVNNAAVSMPSGVVRVGDGIAPVLMGGDPSFLKYPRYVSGFLKTYQKKQTSILGT